MLSKNEVPQTKMTRLRNSWENRSSVKVTQKLSGKKLKSTLLLLNMNFKNLLVFFCFYLFSNLVFNATFPECLKLVWILIFLFFSCTYFVKLLACLNLYTFEKKRRGNVFTYFVNLSAHLNLYTSKKKKKCISPSKTICTSVHTR